MGQDNLQTLYEQDFQGWIEQTIRYFFHKTRKNARKKVLSPRTTPLFSGRNGYRPRFDRSNI